jgi:hypothetical protein
VRQSAGDRLDGENLDFPTFYPTVSAIFRFAVKKGEPATAMAFGRTPSSPVGGLVVKPASFLVQSFNFLRFHSLLG